MIPHGPLALVPNKMRLAAADYLCIYNFFKQLDNFHQKWHREESQSADRHRIGSAPEPVTDMQGHKQWGRKTSVLPQTCIH